MYVTDFLCTINSTILGLNKNVIKKLFTYTLSQYTMLLQMEELNSAN